MARAIRLGRRSKFNAVPTMVAGIKFASKAEANRYRELVLLEKAGEITHLLLQPACLLYVTPLGASRRDPTELIPVGTYRGDFQYLTKAGQVVIEDVKGVRTPIYQLKKRIVEALYGIAIVEV